MRWTSKFTAGIFLVLIVSITTHAEGWRGIVPFHSTRADVEKRLGQPPSPGSRGYTLNRGRSIYFTGEGEVYIVYANDFFGGEEITSCLKTLPEDSVLYVWISPMPTMKLDGLKLNLSKFTTLEPVNENLLGHTGYLNKEAGLLVDVLNGNVEEIYYIASSEDIHLCPKFYGLLLNSWRGA